MFATPTIYAKNAHYIQLTDQEFFQEALEVAKNRLHSGAYDNMSANDVKKATPVVFISTLSKLDKETELFVDRKTLNSSRARRKFIMIDADFDSGEETESEKMREDIIKLAESLNTHVMIYPTVSFPDKPRFRAVMFSKRALTAEAYYQAMSWWFDQLDREPNDDSDLRMSANRNAPVFTNESQLDAVYSNLDDDSLEPLDNALWKEYSKPKRRAKDTSDDTTSPLREVMGESGLTFDERELIEITRSETALSPVGESYHKGWRFIDAVAKSVAMNEISLNTAHRMMEALACRGENLRVQDDWAKGNISALNRSVKEFTENQDALANARDLLFYKEFVKALRSI